MTGAGGGLVGHQILDGNRQHQLNQITAPVFNKPVRMLEGGVASEAAIPTSPPNLFPTHGGAMAGHGPQHSHGHNTKRKNANTQSRCRMALLLGKNRKTGGRDTRAPCFVGYRWVFCGAWLR